MTKIKDNLNWPLNTLRNISLYTLEGLNNLRYSGPLAVLNGVRLTFNYSTQVIILGISDPNLINASLSYLNKHIHRSLLLYYDLNKPRGQRFSVKFNGINNILDVNNEAIRILDENSRVIFVAHGAPNRIEDLAISNGNDLAERLKEVLDLFHKGQEKIIKKCSVISCHVANTDMRIIKRSGEKTGKATRGFGCRAIKGLHRQGVTLTEGLTLRASLVQVTFIGTHQIQNEEENKKHAYFFRHLNKKNYDKEEKILFVLNKNPQNRRFSYNDTSYSVF